MGRFTGLLFRTEVDSQMAYDAISNQIGREGKILPGQGENSWATRTSENGLMDVVFRRDKVVVFLRVTYESTQELSRYAKKIDARVGKMSSSKPSPK